MCTMTNLHFVQVTFMKTKQKVTADILQWAWELNTKVLVWTSPTYFPQEVVLTVIPYQIHYVSHCILISMVPARQLQLVIKNEHVFYIDVSRYAGRLFLYLN